MVARFSADARLNVGIVGATGLVGSMMRQLLAERNFPIARLRLFASARSAGTSIDWQGRPGGRRGRLERGLHRPRHRLLLRRRLDVQGPRPGAAAAGALVIDNSSAWRSDPDVPLVVAEVNPDHLANTPKGIIANPNCTTMAAMPVLKPLHDAAGLKRLTCSTYQAVSGGGMEGIDVLARQIAAVGNRGAELAFDGNADFLPQPEKWTVPIANNVTPSTTPSWKTATPRKNSSSAMRAARSSTSRPSRLRHLRARAGVHRPFALAQCRVRTTIVGRAGARIA